MNKKLLNMNKNNFEIKNGILVRYTGNDENVIIPDGVTSIRNGVFVNRKDLISIIIPDGVTSIGKNTFAGCTNLKSVTIPDGVTSIDDGAFSWCESITNIIIPDSVINIGDSAFSSCERLIDITIPNNVTSIGDHAFACCRSLKSITIPNGVTSIGDWVFEECNNLESIIVNNENKYYSSDEKGVLFNKDKTKLIRYPIGKVAIEYTIPDTVTTIDDYAFFNCRSLKNITILGAVTHIGEAALIVFNKEKFKETYKDEGLNLDDWEVSSEEFYECNITINTPKNSHIETYARMRDININII